VDKNPRNEDTIDALNKLLRGEFAACETYRMAIDHLHDPEILAILRENESSHRQRVRQLQDLLARYGGQPAQGSGAWGAWAKLVQGSANVFGNDAAIGALEQGEDQGISDYSDDDILRDLDPHARQFVQDELYPHQQRTHRVLSDLKHRLKSTV
jgi:uncharacterized protein (TIGR02284 family)